MPYEIATIGDMRTSLGARALRPLVIGDVAPIAVVGVARAAIAAHPFVAVGASVALGVAIGAVFFGGRKRG